MTKGREKKGEERDVKDAGKKGEKKDKKATKKR